MGAEDGVGLGKQQVQKNNRDTAPWRAQAARTLLLLLFRFLPGAQLRAGHWLTDCHCSLESILISQEGGRIGSGHGEETADTQGSKDRRL